MPTFPLVPVPPGSGSHFAQTIVLGDPPPDCDDADCVCSGLSAQWSTLGADGATLQNDPNPMVFALDGDLCPGVVWTPVLEWDGDHSGTTPTIVEISSTAWAVETTGSGIATITVSGLCAGEVQRVGPLTLTVVAPYYYAPPHVPTLTPVVLIPGVTFTAFFSASALSLPTSGTTAVLGTDYSVNMTTGVITVLRSGLGWLVVRFSDAGGTIAASRDYPLVTGAFTVDFSACPGSGSSDYTSKLQTTKNHFLSHGSSSTDATIIYAGTSFDFGCGTDGSFSTLTVQGATMLPKLLV